MRIGVSLPNVGLDHGKEMLLPVAEAAERLGFDSVWAAHHVALPYERSSRYPYQHSGTEVAMSPGMQWLDPLMTLAMVAGSTDRVRPRDERARAALPQPGQPRGGGRGARRAERRPLHPRRGRRVDEGGVRALGIDPAERGARTDEHIEVLRALWTEDPASFEGRFTSFEGIVLATTPAHRGRTADLGRRQHRRRPAPGAAAGRRLARIRGLSRGHARPAASASRGSGRRSAATRASWC